MYKRDALQISASPHASFAGRGVDAMDSGELPLKTGRFASYRIFVATQ